MKKIIMLCCLFGTLVVVSACCRCEVEPLVAENHKLIVPPNFGNMPK